MFLVELIASSFLDLTSKQARRNAPVRAFLFSLFLITAVLCGAAAGVLMLISWRGCRGVQHVSLCVWGAAKKR